MSRRGVIGLKGEPAGSAARLIHAARAIAAAGRALQEPVPAFEQHRMPVNVLVAKDLGGFPVRTDLVGILARDQCELAFADLCGSKEVAVAIRVAVPGKILPFTADCPVSESEPDLVRDDAFGLAGTARSADARNSARRPCRTEPVFSRKRSDSAHAGSTQSRRTSSAPFP